jgi:hypothetical protein
MAKDKLIEIIVFVIEIGKLGYDVDQRKCIFQYNPDFLDSGKYSWSHFLNVIFPIARIHNEFKLVE